MSPPRPPPFPINNSNVERKKSTGPGANSLLESIRKGTSLKKTVTNDRSAPIIEGPKGSSDKIRTPLSVPGTQPKSSQNQVNSQPNKNIQNTVPMRLPQQKNSRPIVPSRSEKSESTSSRRPFISKPSEIGQQESQKDVPTLPQQNISGKLSFSNQRIPFQPNTSAPKFPPSQSIPPRQGSINSKVRSDIIIPPAVPRKSQKSGQEENEQWTFDNISSLPNPPPFSSTPKNYESGAKVGNCVNMKFTSAPKNN